MDPPPAVQIPEFAASVTMNTLPVFTAAGGKFATVDSGGRHCAATSLLYPVHVFAPPSVGMLLISGAGFFHELVAPQNHRFWLAVSMYIVGGLQFPAGAPLPVITLLPPPPDPLICDHVPGAPVVVQKNKF